MFQIQLLQYLKQSNDIIGGENVFADGFYCAKFLKEKHPEAYDILTNTPVDFYDYGSDFYLIFTCCNRSVPLSKYNYCCCYIGCTQGHIKTSVGLGLRISSGPITR